MNITKIYLILAIIGAIVPYVFFISWLHQYSLDLSLLFQNLTANKISLFAWADVMITAIVLTTSLVLTANNILNNQRTVIILATLFIGPSCGLPLYLYFREKRSNIITST